MIAILILIGLFYILGFYFYFKKVRISKILSYLTNLHFISFGLLVLSIGLLWFDLKFSGRLTKTVIGLIFLISGILIFGLTNNRIKRIYTGIVISLPLLLPFSLIFTKSAVIPIVIIASLFDSYEFSQKIDDNYSIEIQNGGILSCGQQIYITIKKGFFIKKEYLDYENQCLPIADSINIIDSTNESDLVVAIYHKFSDIENPLQVKLNLDKIINVP
jgi:CDP-diglyceride synthetase